MTPVRRRAWLLALAGATVSMAATVSIAGRARAAAVSTAGTAPGAPVELRVDSCPRVDERELRHMLSLEIGDLLLPDAPADAARGDRLTVRCQGAEARLIVAGSARAPALERTVRLSDFPEDAAARVLALAGVELLASIDRDGRAAEGVGASVAGGSAPAPEAVAAAAPAPEAETRKAPVRAAATGRRAGGPASSSPDGDDSRPSLFSRTHLGLGVVRQSFLGDAGVTAWGASVTARANRSAGWGVRGDVAGAFGHSDVSGRSARTYLLSAGGFWGPRFGSVAMPGLLGFGARAGLTRFAGEPGAARFEVGTALRGWLGPAMMVHVQNGGPGWGLMLSAEAGVTVLGAVATSDLGAVAAVRGIWLTAGGGLSF